MILNLIFWLILFAFSFVLLYNLIKVIYLIHVIYNRVYFDDSREGDLVPDKVLSDDR